MKRAFLIFLTGLLCAAVYAGWPTTYNQQLYNVAGGVGYYYAPSGRMSFVGAITTSNTADTLCIEWTLQNFAAWPYITNTSVSGDSDSCRVQYRPLENYTQEYQSAGTPWYDIYWLNGSGTRTRYLAWTSGRTYWAADSAGFISLPSGFYEMRIFTGTSGSDTTSKFTWKLGLYQRVISR